MTTKQETSKQGYPLYSSSVVSVDERPAARGHRGSNVGVAGEELSTLSEKTGNMFELFQTHNGEEYTVYVREDGKKFYVDFEEQVRENAVTMARSSPYRDVIFYRGRKYETSK